jgi:threonine/homoserine/homoserine lactone efflux protein
MACVLILEGKMSPMSFTEFMALLVLSTASSFTPGPNTTLSAALAANAGLRGAMHFVWAVPFGWGLLFSLCAAGLGAVVLAVPVLRWGVLAAGVAYLLWLALRLASSQHMATVDAARLRVGFWQGVGLQFLNIKAWMLALSVVAGWVAGRPDAALRWMQVLPVMLVFGFASNFTYALVGAGLKRWLAQGQRLLVFNRCMAAALVATAAWMVWSVA